MRQRFKDRYDAGRRLADQLTQYQGRDDLLVLGLPRGGVPVAFEVARALDAPFDIFLVRKLGVPGREELAMGAIASGGVRVLNQEVVDQLRISSAVLDHVAEVERRELRRRAEAYRGNRPEPEIEDHTVILVDDGLATGATMRAAIVALRQRNPKRIVVAVPTASSETCAQFEDEVDEIVCAITPDPFFGVGLWYEDFAQTTDQEVRQLLAQAANGVSTPTTG